MKLQLALDVLSIEQALEIAQKAEKYIDIIELGTPLLKEESTEEAVKSMNSAFPKKIILADLKIMDTGKLEANLAFRAGADIVTVCAAAKDSTIKEAIKYARKQKKKIMVDLIGIKDKVQRAKEIEKLKPDYICVHTGIDEQHLGVRPFEDLQKAKNAIKTKIAVAGGINIRNIKKVIRLHPEIIIVGSAITSSKNPEKAARKIKRKINKGG